MPANPFKKMEKALEIESKSTHPVHKVGALLCGQDIGKSNFERGHANFWPTPLAEKFAPDEKLGNASTTVHAEIAVILNAPGTEGADLYVTDLPCPNCAKSIAEARIGTVYIDSHAHETPLGKKMEPYFTGISRPLLEYAGVNLLEMNREKRTIQPWVEISESAVIPVEKPVEMTLIGKKDMSAEKFEKLIAHAKDRYGEEPFVVGFAHTRLGSCAALTVRPHRAIGLDEEKAAHLAPLLEKYSLILQPLDRALITSAHYGLTIEPEFLFSAHVPTAREFVNLIGAGIMSLRIGDVTKGRDEWSLRALAQVRERGILEVG